MMSIFNNNKVLKRLKDIMDPSTIKIRKVKRLMKEMGIFPQVCRNFDSHFTSIYLNGIREGDSMDKVIRELIKVKKEGDVITYLFQWDISNPPFQKDDSVGINNAHSEWGKIFMKFRERYRDYKY